MTTPPVTEKWVPLWPNESPKPEIPPARDGLYFKSPGVWEPLRGVVPADTGWHVVDTPGEPVLENGWVNYSAPYGPARFRKTSDGLVILEGLIASGAANTHAFILPPGYRPTLPGALHWHTASSVAPPNPWGTIWTYPSGHVNPNNVGWFALDGIHFYAEPDSTFFKPSDLSGLKVHLDAYQLLEDGLADGAAITTWPNLAGGATVNWTAGGPATFRAAAPCATFSSTGASAAVFPTGIDRDFTVFYFSHMVPGGAWHRALSAYGGPDALGGFWEGYQDSLYFNGTWADNGPYAVGADATWRIVSLDGTTSGPYGAVARIFNNGVYKAQVANPPGGWGTGFWLNGLGGTSERSDWELCELVAYDRRLSDTDRVQVENYLRRKWT